MHRTIAIAGILSVFSLATLPAVPAFAITAKEKMATCKFGADNEKLAGQKRAEFLKRCMSDENDPRGPAVGTPGGRPAPKS
jgi:cytochrome c biogenesis protein CcdA